MSVYEIENYPINGSFYISLSNNFNSSYLYRYDAYSNEILKIQSNKNGGVSYFVSS